MLMCPVSELDFGTLSHLSQLDYNIQAAKGLSAHCTGLWSNRSLVVLLKGKKRWQLDRVTDTAQTELTTTGHGTLPGMSQLQLTCFALRRGYPYSKMQVTICKDVEDKENDSRCFGWEFPSY